jgi:predicted  nucleic acid-binding Zn-ribbon protein
MKKDVVIVLTFLVVVSLGISGYLLIHKSQTDGVKELRREAKAEAAKAKAAEEAMAAAEAKATAEVKAAAEAKEQSEFVEKAIRESLKMPEGELAKVDLEKVTVLYLTNPDITDVGLKELVKLQELKELWLGGIKITDAGVDELQLALPDCEIYGP